MKIIESIDQLSNFEFLDKHPLAQNDLSSREKEEMDLADLKKLAERCVTKKSEIEPKNKISNILRGNSIFGGGAPLPGRPCVVPFSFKPYEQTSKGETS